MVVSSHFQLSKCISRYCDLAPLTANSDYHMNVDCHSKRKNDIIFLTAVQ